MIHFRSGFCQVMLYLEVWLQQYWTITQFHSWFEFRWRFFKNLRRIFNQLIIFLLFGFEQNINVSYWRVELYFCVDFRITSSLVDLFGKTGDLLFVKDNFIVVLLLDLFNFLNIWSDFHDSVLDVILEDFGFFIYFFFHE